MHILDTTARMSTSTAGNTVVGTLTDIDVEVWRLQCRRAITVHVFFLAKRG